MDTHLIEQLRDPYLFLVGEHDPGGLLAIAQCGVVDLHEQRDLVRCAQRKTVVKILLHASSFQRKQRQSLSRAPARGLPWAHL